MTSTALVAHCALVRVSASAPTDPVQALKSILRALATHILAQTAELNGLRVHPTELTRAANPALLAAPGVGVYIASALLVTAGDNPERLRSEAAFAALCGVSPIEASSGKHVRHRLNRGGDRQANTALGRIAMIRSNSDERTRVTPPEETAEGKSPRDTIRCLKRHIAREVYSLLTATPPIAGTDDLRPLRHHTGLAMQAAADHF